MTFRGWLSNAIAPKAQDEELIYSPSDTTISQLLDYIGSGGDTDVLSVFGVGGRFSGRNQAISFPTFFRAVTLLSSMIAQVTTAGSLRIVDRDGRSIRTGTAQRVLDVFRESPDGITPAFSWMEDFAIDYLIEGNALSEISRGPRGNLVGLRRLTSWDAQTIRAANGDPVYKANLADGDDNDVRYLSVRDVAHVRWPRLTRAQSSQSSRRGFASSPVMLLKVALEIGTAGDKFIRDWYRAGGGAHRSNIGISFRGRLNDQQIEGINKLLDKMTASRNRPIIMPEGATFTNLSQSAQNKDQADLRDFQVSELGRIYGVPGPILNQQVTQWGSGVEQLAKFFWRFGLRQHVERVLAPLSYRTLPVGQRFEVDDTDLLRGDAASISALVMALSGSSQDETATREERRKMSGLPLEPEFGTLRETPPPEPPAPESDPDDSGGEEQ